jgi:ferredoxin-NADP reductase
VPGRLDHLPGQHYVVRLTAPDGYTASRSYSIASPTQEPLLEVYVEGLPDGEVSGYLTEVAAPGDTFEVRGPIGGWFVWTGDQVALAIGGGSGVAPLLAMARHARLTGQGDRLRLVAAARTWAELPYGDELAAAGATVALSREPAPGGRPAGRLRPADLAPLVGGAEVVLVCGSARFAETISEHLMSLAVDPSRVRVERFGPTG